MYSRTAVGSLRFFRGRRWLQAQCNFVRAAVGYSTCTLHTPTTITGKPPLEDRRRLKAAHGLKPEEPSGRLWMAFSRIFDFADHRGTRVKRNSEANKGEAHGHAETIAVLNLS